MKLNVEKTVIVVFDNGQEIDIPMFLWQGLPLKREDSARYLGMMLFCSQRFHMAKQEKVQAAIRATYNILSKAINRHFLHTVPLREYFMHCTTPKLLYASPIWAVGCSKAGWKQVEKVQTDYYKTHFQLPILTNGATLPTALGVTPIQVQALINTIGLVQQLKKLPPDRLPNLALQVSKDMANRWWTQFLTWLTDWGLQESKLYKYTPQDVRIHVCSTMSMDNRQAL